MLYHICAIDVFIFSSKLSVWQKGKEISAV